MRRSSYFLLPALLLAVACAENTDDDAAAGADTVPADGAATPTTDGAGGMADPQIAHLVSLANTADIQGGEVAKKKGQKAEVKAFGQQMIDDHTAMNKQNSDLAQRIGITPAENPRSQQLQTEHTQAAERLNGLSGAEFDRAYIDHEVQMHQKLLSQIDTELLPGAQNAELKNLLQQARPKIQEHLTKAQQIQQNLTRTRSP